MGTEKPKSVEVGQRWLSPHARDADANRVVESIDGTKARFDTGTWETVGDMLGATAGWVYLGGPQPPTPSLGSAPRMEAGDDGYPVACIWCGGVKDGLYACEGCCNAKPDLWREMDQWAAGRRDFPRVPSPPGPTGDENGSYNAARARHVAKAAAEPTCARMECHAPGPFSRDGECWFHYLETEQGIATKTAGNADLKRRLREATGRPTRVLFPSIPEYPEKTPAQSHAILAGGVFSLRSSR